MRVAEYRLIGYETRMLRREDFNDDKVDAGDIGAGHTVTAIYDDHPGGRETAPTRSAALSGRERTHSAARQLGLDEMAFLKLRYKLPGETMSRLIEQPVRAADALAKIDTVPAEQRFAVAVAAFGQRLRGESAVDSLATARSRSWPTALAALTRRLPRRVRPSGAHGGNSGCGGTTLKDAGSIRVYAIDSCADNHAALKFPATTEVMSRRIYGSRRTGIGCVRPRARNGARGAERSHAGRVIVTAQAAHCLAGLAYRAGAGLRTLPAYSTGRSSGSPTAGTVASICRPIQETTAQVIAKPANKWMPSSSPTRRCCSLTTTPCSRRQKIICRR